MFLSLFLFHHFFFLKKKRSNSEKHSIEDENFIRETKSKNQNLNFDWKKNYNIGSPFSGNNTNYAASTNAFASSGIPTTSISKRTQPIDDRVSLQKFIIEDRKIPNKRPLSKYISPSKNKLASTLRGFGKEFDDLPQSPKPTRHKKHSSQTNIEVSEISNKQDLKNSSENKNENEKNGKHGSDGVVIPEKSFLIDDNLDDIQEPVTLVENILSGLDDVIKGFDELIDENKK